MKVATPAAKIALLINAVEVLASKPKAAEITIGTTIIPPKAAKICCNPNKICINIFGLSLTPYIN